MRPARRRRLPPPVRTALQLDRGDRVLAAARLVNDAWVIATFRGLHRVGRALGDDPATARRGWDEVAQAVWSDTASMLQVTWADNDRQWLLELAGEVGYLPEVVRERVEASVVLSRRVAVPGRRGVRVAIRRRPDGALMTQVSADRGVDLTEPGLAARVAADLADLAEQAGLTT